MILKRRIGHCEKVVSSGLDNIRKKPRTLPSEEPVAFLITLNFKFRNIFFLIVWLNVVQPSKGFWQVL